MKTRMIAPFAVMLFGLSACTYVEDGPYVSYQTQFAVGGPLYYAGGPVTWRYYNGYTYHLYDHHGQFVGYAYYDYDHYYRIADATGVIVYFLRWAIGGWRIENHLGHHLGFIHSDNHGNHWIADTHGKRHGGMLGWGRSGSHGHAHAARHDDRIEHREARHQYNAERGRWRDKKHDAEIRHSQEHATHNVGKAGKNRSGNDHDDGNDRRRSRKDNRKDNRNQQVDHSINMTPAPSAIAPRRNRDRAAPQFEPNAPAGPKARGHSREEGAVNEPRRMPRRPAAQPSVQRSAPTPAPATQPSVQRSAPAPTPAPAAKTAPSRAPAQAAPAATTAPKKKKQAAPKPKRKPSSGKPRGKKTRESIEEEGRRDRDDDR